MGENSLEAIHQYLEASLSPQYAKESEGDLRSIENQPGFTINLLHVIASGNITPNVRLAGALFFKNLIRRKWINEDGEYLFPVSDVNYIKREILDVMVKLPDQLKVQVGEAISIIAESDFPHNWPNLIDDLVTKLSLEDFVQNKGILIVAHSIFKRWRPLFRSDELFLEIKLVLEKFTQPFMALLTKADELISEALTSQNKASLGIYCDNLLLLIQIYYDFNCQDIPEFFEDNMTGGMEIMHKYLVLETGLLTDADSDDEVDILIKIKTSILELVILYVSRYADVFDPLIENFISAIWSLINTYVTKQQKFDFLVVKALAFLTSVTKMAKYQPMFNNEAAFKEVIEKIILPNIAFREVDEENFEDEPINFVRSDLEGSDFDSRRKSATDFLRELKEVNTEMLTGIVMTYVNKFLSSSQNNWKNKDTAIYLFSSLATKGSVTNVGVASTNVLVDVVKFFTENIADDLLSDDSSNAILKTDAIKYILIFRNQLTKDQLLTTIPLLVNHLRNANPVVYTYAAITIEKLLAMTNFSDANHTPVFNKDDIHPLVNDLLTNLFGLILADERISPEKLSENEFIIKCVMRVLNTIESSMEEWFRFTICEQLIKILKIIAKNPSNPRFSHYIFESLGLLIKYSSGDSKVIEKFIETLLPSLLEILNEDVQEFVPYTFQVLAFLLELYPTDLPLPEYYAQLIKPLLSPSVWEFRGNIPGITRLLIAVLNHHPAVFTSNDQSLTPLLGVFQKLIASKVNDTYGFDLLIAIFLSIPTDLLKNYLNQIAVLLLTRLKNSRTEKFVKKFVLFICSLSCIPLSSDLNSTNLSTMGPDFAIDLVDSVQPGVFAQIYSSFILPTSSTLSNLQDKKLVNLGLLEMLKSSNFETQYKDLVIPTVEQITKNLVSYEGLKKTTGIANTGTLGTGAVAINDNDLEGSSFGSQFSKLISIQAPPFDPLPNIKSSDQAPIRNLVLASINILAPTGILTKLSSETKNYLSTISN